MTTHFARADRALRRLPDPALAALGVVVLLALTSVKASAAWHDAPLIDFFLVPVATVAWLARVRVWACAVAAVAAGLTIWAAGAAVATLLSAPASVAELIHRADELMYRAKQRGPGRVEAAPAASPPREARRALHAATPV